MSFACSSVGISKLGCQRTGSDAVTFVNATEMGLAGYVWSRDVGRAWRLGERLDMGILGINEALPQEQKQERIWNDGCAVVVWKLR